jgi:hypothetical protein
MGYCQIRVQLHFPTPVHIFTHRLVRLLLFLRQHLKIYPLRIYRLLCNPQYLYNSLLVFPID